MIGRITIAASLLAALLASTTLQAHGDAAAKHGGIVKVANDITFELVVKPDSAELYLDDHGEPMSTENLRGKLTVLNGGSKADFELKPAGGNRLEAAGARIAAGAKVVAALTTADGKPAMTVRFAVK
ncbi:MAG: hypothetical protein ACT4O5_14100 [Gammaproteobacteria bacterium]